MGGRPSVMAVIDSLIPFARILTDLLMKVLDLSGIQRYTLIWYVFGVSIMRCMFSSLCARRINLALAPVGMCFQNILK